MALENTNGKKRKTWLWILGWIFIFPVPLTVILIKKPNMSKAVKYGIIAAAWVVYVLLMVIGTVNNNSKTVESYEYVIQTTTSAITTNSPTTAEQTTVQPTTVEPTTVQPTTVEATTVEPITVKPTETPTERPTEAAAPIVFTNYTNYVEAGSNATVTIQGAPNTEYCIHVYYSTRESKAEGLEAKISDSDGSVTWEWKVGPNTSPGTHEIIVDGGGTKNGVTFEVFEQL